MRFLPLLAGLALCLPPAGTAFARPGPGRPELSRPDPRPDAARSDIDRPDIAGRGRQRGDNMPPRDNLPLREIEGRIVPTMPGMQYLGPEYDSSMQAYRLKFIRDGRVVYVDVDGRTGRVIGRSQ